MDPVSAVAGFAATAHLCFTFIEAFRDLPNEVSCLETEISELERAIHLVQASLFNASMLPSSREDVTRRPLMKDLSRVDRFLQHNLPKAGEHIGGDHWQWIRKKGNIERLRRQLTSIKYDIATVDLPESRFSFASEFTGRHNQPTISIPPGCGPSLGLSGSPDASDPYPQGDSRRFLDIYWQAESRARVRDISAQLQPRPQNTLFSPTAEQRWLPYPKQDLPAHRSSKNFCLSVFNRIRACYILIFLGFLTIVGSLVPALWRSIPHNDLSGGFTLAQYILGVGALVVGCAVAIHSKTCTCWSSSCQLVPYTPGSDLELEAVDDIGNLEPYELPG